jgi:hypothetical protein
MCSDEGLRFMLTKTTSFSFGHGSNLAWDVMYPTSVTLLNSLQHQEPHLLAAMDFINTEVPAFF